MATKMIVWVKTASQTSVVVRALKYAVFVGALLIAINQGDVILRGEIDWVHICKMALTICVPYAVSTASSVAALLESGGAGQ